MWSSQPRPKPTSGNQASTPCGDWIFNISASETPTQIAFKSPCHALCSKGQNTPASRSIFSCHRKVGLWTELPPSRKNDNICT